jgi:hypothetical protein
MEGAEAADRNVEMWKIKKLIKSLEAARGYYKIETNLVVYELLAN